MKSNTSTVMQNLINEFSECLLRPKLNGRLLVLIQLGSKSIKPCGFTATFIARCAGFKITEVEGNTVDDLKDGKRSRVCSAITDIGHWATIVCSARIFDKIAGVKIIGFDQCIRVTV